MVNLSNQQKGSLLAFVGVMFITPDSLFIRLSSIDTWELLFYRGAIPSVVILIALILFYKSNLIKVTLAMGLAGLFYALTFFLHHQYYFYCVYTKYKCRQYSCYDRNSTNVVCYIGRSFS